MISVILNTINVDDLPSSSQGNRFSEQKTMFPSPIPDVIRGYCSRQHHPCRDTDSINSNGRKLMVRYPFERDPLSEGGRI